MEDTGIVLERHEQKIEKLEQDIADLKAVQTEIRAMNETLVTLANELKHTNQHLQRHEQKIEEMENRPQLRIQQIVTAVISAMAGAIISMVINCFVA